MSNKLYQKVKNFIPEVEWVVYEPLVEKINRLKAEKNAVILAHNYMTPEIYHCVADIVGCLLYTSPSPRDRQKSRMPSSA